MRSSVRFINVACFQFRIRGGIGFCQHQAGRRAIVLTGFKASLNATLKPAGPYCCWSGQSFSACVSFFTFQSRILKRLSWVGRIVIVVIFMSCILSPAHGATIFKCQDEKGRPVFSQTPCPDQAVKGRTEAHQVWREMRGLVAEGLQINAQIGADVKSIKQCKHNMAQFKSKLETLEPTIRQVALAHPKLESAYEKLQECAVCRVSASTYCRASDQYLNEAMDRLMYGNDR